MRKIVGVMAKFGPYSNYFGELHFNAMINEYPFILREDDTIAF